MTGTPDPANDSLPWPDLSRCPTVLLVHTLADASHHIDWMLARDPHGESPLLSFRLKTRIDHASAGTVLDAIQIDDHRPRYLTYEGKISHGRGTVQQLNHGTITACETDRSASLLTITWHERNPLAINQRLIARPGSDEGHWSIQVQSADIVVP